MHRLVVCLAVSASVVIVSGSGARDSSAAFERPPILGVAHIGIKTDDLAKARQFYGHDLGYQEAFTLDKPSGGLLLTNFKVNDHQYIQVFPDLKSPAEDRLSHIAFETTNALQLRTTWRARASRYQRR